MTIENPFTPIYSRQSFVETPGRAEALRRLDDGLGAREPFLLITGDPGIGKTTLVREAIERWGTRVAPAFLAYTALTGSEFLEEVIRRFGFDPPEGAGRPKLVARIEQALAEIASRGQVAMLIVDDAHDLAPEVLEELRLLLNVAQQAQRPLEVLLIGLPALEERLEQPAMAALRQRVSVRARVEALSEAETRRYLHHRVSVSGGDGPTLFSKKSCREIALRARGVPRQINALAAEAMKVAAVWGDATVGAEHMQIAAAALGGLVATGNIAALEEGAGDRQAATPPSPVARPVMPSAVTPPPVAAPPPAATPSRPPAAAPPPSAVLTPKPAPKPIEQHAPPPPLRSESSAPTKPARPEPIAAPKTPPARPTERFAASSREDVTTPSVTSQDSREWVARFIGDKGPIKISSQAVTESTWKADFSEPIDEPTAGVASVAPEAPAEERRAGDRRQSDRRQGAERRMGSDRRRGGDRRGTGARDAAQSRNGSRAVAPMAISVGLAAMVLVGAIVLVIRNGSSTKNRAAAPPDLAAGNTVTTKPEKSAASSRRSGSAPSSESASEASSSRSRQPFTLDVGGYSNMEVAFQERDRLQRLTGFQGWVVPDPSGSGYRVVLNSFRNRERAESAAHMLMNSRTLGHVSVVSLPSRDVRQ